MKLIRSLLVVGMTAAFSGSGANATDYYVQAITPGPVQGTALLPVSLQASKEEAGIAKAAPAPRTRAWYKARWLRRAVATGLPRRPA